MWINFNHVSEFVSISDLLQSRKNKINSKDITERFLFSLFDRSIMSQIVERVCKIILFLMTSDWFSLIIVSNVSCIWFLRISSINFIVQVEMGLYFYNIFFITFYITLNIFFMLGILLRNSVVAALEVCLVYSFS